MDILSKILALPVPLQLITEQIDSNCFSLVFTLASTSSRAYCPLCQTPSTKIHSHYERTLSDLNWGIYRVSWHLWVRKFFCRNQACPRKVFAERLSGIVKPYARKTERLINRICQIGLALGGQAGERLSERLDYLVSRQTLLSWISCFPLREIKDLKVVGVDDWAYRKGQTYGTILVDLEKHQPLALLKDREAETLSEWLKQYPTIEIVSRDRSKTYRSGAEQGAKGAQQVADRFHLLQNLGETLERLLNRHTREIEEAEKAIFQAVRQSCDGTLVVPLSPVPRAKVNVCLSEQRREKRKALYEGVWQFRNSGWTQQSIALELGISERTVRRYLQSPTFPERGGRRDRGRGLLDPYKDQLLQWWNGDCRNSKELLSRLKNLGYRGGYRTLQRYLQRLRDSLGVTHRQRQSGRALPHSLEPKKRPLTVRRVASLILRRLENREEEDERFVRVLRLPGADLEQGIALARDFAEIVRNRSPELLDAWIQTALGSQIPPLVNLYLLNKSG